MKGIHARVLVRTPTIVQPDYIIRNYGHISCTIRYLRSTGALDSVTRTLNFDEETDDDYDADTPPRGLRRYLWNPRLRPEEVYGFGLGSEGLRPRTPLHQAQPEGTEAPIQGNTASGANPRSDVPATGQSNQNPNVPLAEPTPRGPDATGNAPPRHETPPGGHSRVPTGTHQNSGQTHVGSSAPVFRVPTKGTQPYVGPTFHTLPISTLSGSMGQGRTGHSRQIPQGPVGQSYHIPQGYGYEGMNRAGSSQHVSQPYGIQPIGGTYGNPPTGQPQFHQYYPPQHIVPLPTQGPY
uniref:uncharacterized protein LOC122583286 n=1 Tax=Erigeron canadensis TaxID=72917 RepID=UPI001CB99718|nr:uncharacterized protein LOC122583286 [Erigeron canadensis]